MMKERLRFLLAVLLAAMLLFSCASKDEDAAADELPAVEAAETAVPAAVADAAGAQPAAQPVAAPSAPAANEAAAALPDADEAAAADKALEAAPADEAPAADDALEDEAADAFGAEDELSEDDLFPAGGLTAEYIENEFVPYEEEKDYTIDVAGYYDGFSISEDDFVAVEVPEPAPVPAITAEVPAAVESPAQADLVPEKEVALEEVAPVMEQLYVPSPREDMKKPVAVITEEQADRAAERELEVALDELQDLLDSIPEPEEPPKPVPSRSVTVSKNDILVVPYQGNWWVYLGDANGSGALVFQGRDYISDRTIFTLRATHEGNAMLHFYKQDIIGGVMVDDYLEVAVGEVDGASEKIELDDFVISQIKPVPPAAETDEALDEDAAVADGAAGSAAGQNAGEAGEAGEEAQPAVRKPSVLGSAAARKTTAANETRAAATAAPAATSAYGSSAPAAEKADGITYMQYPDARAAANGPGITDEAEVMSGSEGEAASAAPSAYTAMNDEELFRKAQELEATDIEGALELYQLLVARYPASPYWTQADRRITYINRFYFFKR